VINAYLLVYAVLLITTGRLGDVLGQRPMFVAGLVVFTLASCLFVAGRRSLGSEAGPAALVAADS
jgi:MFS family permease